ncbi:MAG: AMIN-like domain-containing (lipo)protein [Candidatus Limnocylindrales bacterium]
MAVDDPFESRLTSTLHHLLDGEAGPHPRWADSPAAARIAGGDVAGGHGAGRDERRGGRVTLLLLAAALVVAIVGGTALVGGRLPGWLRLAVRPGPTATPSLIATAPSPSPTSSASPTSSQPIPTPSPTSTPAPTEPPMPTSGSPTAGCASGFTLAGPATMPVTVSDVRVGTHPGYDRIVFDVADPIFWPNVTVVPAEPPFTMDASGQTVEVSGTTYLRITLDHAAGPNLTARTYDQRPGYPILTELRNTGDYEGVQTWIAGLAGPACVRVSTLSSPNRVVVDLLAP